MSSYIDIIRNIDVKFLVFLLFQFNKPLFSLINLCLSAAWSSGLKYLTDDQHGLGSKPTYAILLCP